MKFSGENAGYATQLTASDIPPAVLPYALDRHGLSRVLIPSVRFRVFSWVGKNGFVNPAELFRGLGRMKQASREGHQIGSSAAGRRLFDAERRRPRRGNFPVEPHAMEDSC